MKTRFSFKFIYEGQEALLREVIRGQGISKRALTDIKFTGGQLLVNGQEETVRKQVASGDSIEIIFPEEQRSEGLVPIHHELVNVYEDDHILVVNKPEGLASIPSKDHSHDSLANRIAGYYERMNYPTTVHMVTRLDRETSGLVLIAKHRHAHHLLSEQMQRNGIRKVYRAIVEGTLPTDNGEIVAPIGREDHSIIKRCISEDGKYAKTSYAVINSWALAESLYQYVELRLWTGRTHQIRVHMSHIGCPLAGDELYGGHKFHISRHALHAYSLSFVHPFYGDERVIEHPLPEDMQALVERGQTP
ncbi:RluA family pseudouridine synthase [Chryseomicrobium sp. FSL W7-1435]|uniref:RluA family pseudouridine synthase n=1 Tax=Chryseomicrobium sp. FSL W7-1435 TaxID=2921704 RepID=UPI00315A1D47